ncbi:HNH endonuclease [Paramuribaculum intestinale]|uniref:HNH endonuclease n=1 Tax=Paramuribaculum intestinale TaxID=2094151 RepID=UPI00272BF329|nr:HNH endonuclease [Paramuribaculum intestinale]
MLYKDKEYLSVMFCKNGKHKRFSIHRLVAEAFIPNPENKPQVNHIDENPNNNCVWNLEWVTAKENCNHGTRIARIKSNMPHNKAIYQLSMSGEIVAEYPTIQSAAKTTDICAGHICDCCKGNRSFANGYKWRYVDEILNQHTQTRLNEREKGYWEGRKRTALKNSKRVFQCDMQGNVLGEYISTAEASRQTGICTPGIINVCNGKARQAGGYIWRYAD